MFKSTAERDAAMNAAYEEFKRLQDDLRETKMSPKQRHATKTKIDELLKFMATE